MNSGQWRSGDGTLHSVLFDLDGTLADTAPDLGYALNQQRLARGLPEIAIAELTIHASSGARGLLQHGFGISPGDSDYPSMREELPVLYDETASGSSA